jgi:hypothetical protein
MATSDWGYRPYQGVLSTSSSNQNVHSSAVAKNNSTESSLLTEHGHEEHPLKNRTPRFAGIFSPHGWLWEILSLVLAVVSLIGLVCLLRQYQNKASPDWKYGITLNTIVSVISTVFRISILVSVAASISQMGWVWLARKSRNLDDVCVYDSASRGPWGSIRLLWRTKFV